MTCVAEALPLVIGHPWPAPGGAPVRLPCLDRTWDGVPHVELWHSQKPTSRYFNGNKTSELSCHHHFENIPIDLNPCTQNTPRITLELFELAGCLGSL
jgi:hypothetical protein